MAGDASYWSDPSGRGHEHTIEPQLCIQGKSTCPEVHMYTDSQTITRTTRRFNTLKVPRKLEASLPYASKTKHIAPQRKETYMQSRAVVMEPEEKKAIALMQQIQALRKDKVARRKDKQEERRAEHRKEKGVIDEKKEAKAKEERREKYRKEGIKRKREEQGGKGGGDKRSKA
jgi:ribosome biogenesis protein BMS1